MEEKFVTAYLTDAAHVSKVFGCKNKALLGKLMLKLKYPLEDLDDEYEDLIGPNKDAKHVLLEIINGKQTLKDLRLMYLFIYEQICLSFGEHLYAPNDDFSAEYFLALKLKPSAFMPIELSSKHPILVSIKYDELETYKEKFSSLESYEGYDEDIIGEDRKDYLYAFDEAIKKKKDLVFCLS